jgi:hypothetical protein
LKNARITHPWHHDPRSKTASSAAGPDGDYQNGMGLGSSANAPWTGNPTSRIKSNTGMWHKEDEMTRDEILKMEAGREMDALIHWLFFITNKDDGYSHWKENTQLIIYYYSIDIAAAWKVVEKVTDVDSETNKFRIDKLEWAGPWQAMFVDEYYNITNGKEGKCFDVIADTAPLAICRAALLAVMEA